MKTIELIFSDVKKHYVEEAYKTLRANIQFCGTDVKAIAVTSSHPNEGKSTVSMNLSRVLAEAGKKVLYVDADLRKSVALQRYASEAIHVGLSQYLSGQNEWDDVVCATQIEGLHVVFSGQFPANPVELLGSRAFARMIEEKTKVYDYVIVDTPPLGLVIDCAVIANVCDSAVIVVASEKTSIRRAKTVKDQLAKSGVHILGVILNKVRIGGMGYRKRYGRYGRGYGKYRKYETPKKSKKNKNADESFDEVVPD
ncbi:MAG: CpsD/CapB family tyrosine-protein kinase [Clostridia bacterium]|nr:CpsD/CapB family tyrosine-protein kinase [Clostridia bacterium]